MSVAPATTNGADRTPAAELQEAARDAYRQSLRDGEPLTGAEIGDRFGRSARWGRARIAEAHAERHALTNPRPDAYKAPAPTAEGAAAATGAAATANRAGGAATDAGAPPTAATAAMTVSDGRHQPAEVVRPLAASARGPSADSLRRDNDDQQLGSKGHQSAATADDRAGDVPTACQTAQPMTGRSVFDTVEEAVSPAIRRTTTLAVLAVAVVAAVASFDHQRILAEMAGEGWRSWLLPISVDGLVVAASMSLLVHRRTRQGAGLLAWTALLLGLGASLVANVVAADPTLADPALIRRLVAAWPPLALGISFELTVQLLATSRSRP